MRLQYFGHSTFSVELGGKRVLFDPFITSNPIAQAAGIRADDLTADFILISHAHGDHLEDAAGIAQRTGATCVSNFEICNWLNAQGVSKTQPMNHGGSVQLDCGTVQYVNAIHSSSFPDGSYGGNPGGFVVRGDGGCLYYSGDTALTMDMKLFGEEVTLGFAVLCIGDVFTMGVADALKAARLVGVKKVVGVHYDTFPPIKIDRGEAKELFSKAGLTLLLPAAGETIEI